MLRRHTQSTLTDTLVPYTTLFRAETRTGMPQTFTFDMGLTGKLSRFRVWERSDIYAFAHGNPKRWALWGSNDPKDDALPPDVSGLAPGDQVGSWIFIGYYEAPSKPSGRRIGDNTPEDMALTTAGFDYKSGRATMRERG